MTVRTLTPEQRADYVAHGGNVCPFCGSRDLDADQPECHGDEGYANCQCSSCKTRWTDKWVLAGICEEDQ